jgi:copper resistance protein D
MTIIRIASTLLDLTAIFLFLGSTVCMLWIIPSDSNSPHALFFRQLRSRAAGILAASGLLLVVTTGFLLLVHASSMSGAPLLEAYSYVPAILERTHFGTIWIVRCTALVMLAFFFVSFRSVAVAGAGTSYVRRTSQTFSTVLLVLSAALLLFTRSANSHAADAGDFTTREFMDSLHLLAGGSWGGGLLVLTFLLLRMNDSIDGRTAGPRTILVSRFSLAAGLEILLVAVSGTYNAWLELGSWRAFVSTAYGRILAAKIILVAIVLAIAVYNRYVLLSRLKSRTEPGLGRGLGHIVPPTPPGDPTPLVSRAKLEDLLTQKIVLEAIFVAAILICTAILVNAIPGRELIH